MPTGPTAHPPTGPAKCLPASAACQPVAPQAAISTPEPELALTGVWDWQAPGVLVHFTKEGTYVIAPSLYDFSLGSSYDSGTWRLEGDVLTLESSPDSLLCEGAKAVYQVQTPDDEQTVFVQQSDGCEPRAIEDGAQK